MYRYEVFVSYRRGTVHSQWLIEHFLPLFKDLLREEVADRCGRDTSDLFHDENDILPGMSIPAKVANGLKTARCLLALVSPRYFLSHYCLVEWESFKLRGQSESRDLLVPAVLNPGLTVQAKVGDTMWADLSDYLIVGEGFKKSERYVQFQDEVKKLARRVADISANAPDWKEFQICDPPSRAIVPPAPIQLVGL